MDFNYLYHRQQISLMRADVAACVASRAAHQGLAHLYAGLIEKRKADRQPAALCLHPDLGSGRGI